jgi:general secretion pathway protein D
MQALAPSSDANILSTPNILTTDNEEAEIVVGSNVPFITQSGGLGGLSSIAPSRRRRCQRQQQRTSRVSARFSSGLGVQIQRQDVALTLKITPRISNANFVTLEVDQVVEEIESTDQTLGPTTSKRSVKTTVVVKDQQTIVIGGLQKNVQTQSVNKVPFLGEIPIIGYFFRDTATRGERRNLILMLTPHVIESQDDFRAIFKRKMEEHREFVARFHKEGDTYIVGVDYAKKHGALESIHKAVRTAQAEQASPRRGQEADPGPPTASGRRRRSADRRPHRGPGWQRWRRLRRTHARGR